MLVKGLNIVESVTSEAASTVAQRHLSLFAISSFFFPDVNLLIVQCFLAKQSVQIQTHHGHHNQMFLPPPPTPPRKKKQRKRKL